MYKFSEGNCPEFRGSRMEMVLQPSTVLSVKNQRLFDNHRIFKLTSSRPNVAMISNPFGDAGHTSQRHNHFGRGGHVEKRSVGPLMVQQPIHGVRSVPQSFPLVQSLRQQKNEENEKYSLSEVEWSEPKLP